MAIEANRQRAIEPNRQMAITGKGLLNQKGKGPLNQTDIWLLNQTGKGLLNQTGKGLLNQTGKGLLRQRAMQSTSRTTTGFSVMYPCMQTYFSTSSVVKTSVHEKGLARTESTMTELGGYTAGVGKAVSYTFAVSVLKPSTSTWQK